MDRTLEHEGSLPLVTDDTWSGVVERSHAPLHPFYPDEKWRGEVTKVALVCFFLCHQIVVYRNSLCNTPIL